MQINLKLVNKLISSIKESENAEKLKQIQHDLLGKDGLINNYFKSLKGYSKIEAQAAIKELNQLKQKALVLFKEQEEFITKQKMMLEIQKEYLDVTLPGRKSPFGKLHPLSAVINEIIDILSVFGFEIISGNELEDDWHNFSALNIPKYHPARQMQDTFYIKDATDVLLRTQTSNVQIRFMSQVKPPFKFLSYGKVYRKDDNDSTHIPMFHQIEGVYINKDVNFANMKFILEYLLHKLFKNSVEIRFRPSFFPFTSPSCEIDIKLPNTDKWMEVLGCGMVHSNILKNVGIDTKWQGFAFGAGIERLTMIKYGIKDIRYLFECNLAWLKHYGVSPLNLNAY